MNLQAIVRTLLAISIVLACGCANAQVRTGYPAERGLTPADFPRVIDLKDGVYAYEDLRAPGFTTVSLFVVGTDGVLLADGQGSPEATRRLLERIATVTDKPVKWYVVGSNHGDHTGGNVVLPRDVRFIVTPYSKAQLEADAAQAKPDAPPVIVPPVAMTGTKESVDVGGRTVDVLFLGRAHTGGDLVVSIPSKRILFLSEVGFNRVFPAMRSAYPDEWLATIDRALAMDVDLYVPGHGFVDGPVRSRENLVEFRAALASVIAEALKQADWGPYGSWMFSEPQRVVALRRVYQQMDGQLR